MGVRCQGWPLIFAAWIRCSKTSKTAHTAKNGLAYTHSQIVTMDYNGLTEWQRWSALWNSAQSTIKPILWCSRSSTKVCNPVNAHAFHLHAGKSIENQSHKCNVWCMALTLLVPSLLCQYCQTPDSIRNRTWEAFVIFRFNYWIMRFRIRIHLHARTHVQTRIQTVSLSFSLAVDFCWLFVLEQSSLS